MSYQQKYLKYKNKYLGLKSKYGHLLNISNTETSLPEPLVPDNKLFNELNTETPTSMPLDVKIVNSMTGGGKIDQVTETETTVRNTDNTEEVRKLFKQIAGAKSKKKSKKSKNVARKHFFHDSDLDDSTDTSSLARDDSEFSSSEIDW